MSGEPAEEVIVAGPADGVMPILALAAQILLTLSVLYGLGNHNENVSYDDGAIAALYNWTAEMIVIIDIGLAKVAIIAFILMLQGPTHPKLKWVLHFIWITNMIVNFNQIILILLQCKPLKGFWDYRIEADCSFIPTTNKVGFFQGGWGAATDFALAIYPVFLYWNLQMSRRLKLGLMALTGGGFIVGAAAILKTIYIRVIQVTDDVTWEFADLVIWLFVEIWLVLILSSIPPLRPLFVRVYRKTFIVVSSKNRTRGTARDESDHHATEEDHVPLSIYPGEPAYKVNVRHPSAGIITRELNHYGDSDSAEAILPATQQEIWVTRSTTIQRSAGAAQSKSDGSSTPDP